MSASSLRFLGGWSPPTLDSAGCGSGSFPAPSRELDAPVPSMTSRSSCCSESSTLLSLARSSWLGSLDPLSLSRATLEAPSGSFSSSCSILFATPLSVVYQVPNSSSNGRATQALGGEAHSPGMIGGVNFWRMHTSLSGEIYTDVDISGTLPVLRPRGSFDVQHEFCVPSLLSTELSHCPASDHS